MRAKLLPHTSLPPRSGYQLSQAAMRVVSFARTLKNPRSLIPANSTEEPSQQTAFTILHSLFAAGWKVHEGGAKDMQNLTITAGAPAASAKRILKSARAERVNRKYLAVLLEIQQNSEFRAFLREHDVKSVQHGANDKYYSALLSREPQRLLRTDFEMDVAGQDRNIQDAQVVAATSAARRGKFKLPDCLFGDVFPSSITKGGGCK